MVYPKLLGKKEFLHYGEDYYRDLSWHFHPPPFIMLDMIIYAIIQVIHNSKAPFWMPIHLYGQADWQEVKRKKKKKKKREKIV